VHHCPLGRDVREYVAATLMRGNTASPRGSAPGLPRQVAACKGARIPRSRKTLPRRTSDDMRVCRNRGPRQVFLPGPSVMTFRTSTGFPCCSAVQIVLPGRSRPSSASSPERADYFTHAGNFSRRARTAPRMRSQSQQTSSSSFQARKAIQEPRLSRRLVQTSGAGRPLRISTGWQLSSPDLGSDQQFTRPRRVISPRDQAVPGA